MSQWQQIASLFITENDKVLLLQSEKGWYLPTLKTASLMFKFHHLQREIEQRYHADMTILRSVWFNRDAEQQINHAWFLMENHTRDWVIPKNAQWYDADTLATLALSDEKFRDDLIGILKNIQQPAPELRPPYMQKDWFADMRHWVSECLQNAGYTLTRPPEQFKQFIFSAILRTETKQGVFYAKVANPHYPLFCHEPRTMQALAQIVPENIPAPFAIHPTQAAGIYSDFGNVLWDAERNRDDYRAVIQSYAKLQIKTASHLDTLEAAGCINRRLDTVKAMFSDLLQDDAVRGHLSDQQQHDLKNCQTKINQLCDELTAFNVPYTLVHGDFHDGNIALNDQKITFFDWTDACIAHPFIDICTIVDFKAQDADTKFLDFMRDTYLACWTAYEPLDRLQAIYKRAVVISAVHNLISYWTILINTDKSYLSVVMWTIPQYADTIVNSIKALETTP